MVGRFGVLPLALFLLACADGYEGDVLIESNVQGELRMEGSRMPPFAGTKRTWIGDGKIAISNDVDDQSIFFRPDLGKLQIADDNARVYYESEYPGQSALVQLPPAARWQVASWKFLTQPRVEVFETDETRVVSGFETRLTRMQITALGQSFALDFWLTEDLGVPDALLRELGKLYVEENPLLPEELGERMEELEGYPMRTEFRMETRGEGFEEATLEVTEEVQNVERRAAPPEAFEVPAGYRRLELPPEWSAGIASEAGPESAGPWEVSPVRKHVRLVVTERLPRLGLGLLLLLVGVLAFKVISDVRAERKGAAVGREDRVTQARSAVDELLADPDIQTARQAEERGDLAAARTAYERALAALAGQAPRDATTDRKRLLIEAKIRELER